MNCAEFQTRLPAWLAGESDETISAALEAHLQDCPHCTALLEPAGDEDQLLRTALAEPRAAARVAERTRREIQRQAQPSSVVSRKPYPWLAWIVPLLTAAAGFLLAMVILQREERGQQPTEDSHPPPVAHAPPPPPPVAHLVVATGRVEHFDKQRQDWVPIDQIQRFACPTDSRLRTTPDVRCELRTGDGGVIRLNEQTEVTLLGTSSIELCKGQVWCRSPQESALEVRVATTAVAKEPKATPATMWCASGASCLVTGTEKTSQVQVVSAAGEINLKTASDQQTLAPGQIAEISNGAIVKPARYVDTVLSTRWMQPLLVSPGADDKELQERVDVLLAQIGRSKIATLYEQEIRSLGEHAVLPLVRFIQSPLAAEDPRRRSEAMRLTADLAPVWLIPDLIDLLEDREGYVRQSAAATLHRLTGMDMNLAATDWREPPNEAQQTAVQDWRNWWATHRHQYPSPRVQITKEVMKQ